MESDICLCSPAAYNVLTWKGTGVLDCRTGQHQAHPWPVHNTYLDGVFDGFAVACPMGKSILVSTILKSLARHHPLPCSELSSCIYPSRRTGMFVVRISLLEVFGLNYARRYGCLFIIHIQVFVLVLHIYYPLAYFTIRIHTVRYYLDCRHNRHSRHSASSACKPPPHPPTVRHGGTTS